MFQLRIECFGCKITYNGVKFIGLFRWSPSLLIRFDALWTEINADHIIDSCQFPLRNVLASPTSNIEYMQNTIISLSEIECFFYEFAHPFGLSLNEDSFDPVVEWLQLKSLRWLSLKSIMIIFCMFLVVFKDVRVPLVHIHYDYKIVNEVNFKAV